MNFNATSQKFSTIALMTLGALALSACGSSNFEGGRQSKQPKQDSPVKQKPTLSSLSNATSQSADSTVQNLNPDEVAENSQPEEGFPKDDAKIIDGDQIGSLLAGLISAAGDLGSSDNKTEPMPKAEVCKTTSTTVVAQTPIDLVFNIDVSTSMGSHLNTVKNNVKLFAQKMANSGVNIRFGAIGFVNKVEQNIAFQSGNSFSNAIANWSLIDNGNKDFQEAGQAGIEQSLVKLLQAGRANSTKIIVHISDAVSFAGTDINDLSLDKLAQTMRNAAPALGNFLFYSSASSETGVTGFLAKKYLDFSPKDQANTLRRLAGGLKGKSLSFPFKADTLTRELPAEILTEVKSYTSCD